MSRFYKWDTTLVLYRSIKHIVLLIVLTSLSLPLAAERLGEVSTKFRMLGPNDKVVIDTEE